MTNAIETSEGWIPHMELFAGCGLIHAPVKLQTDTDGKVHMVKTSVAGAFLPMPLRREGRLAFALPGGGEFQV